MDLVGQEAQVAQLAPLGLVVFRVPLEPLENQVLRARRGRRVRVLVDPLGLKGR